MDKTELRELAAQVAAKSEAIKAFDTPENEKRLIELLATRQIKVTKRKKKAADRYKITMQDGSIEPATLLDLNDIAIKFNLV